MSDNTFTEITSTGWLSRIGDSIKGVLVGVIMIIASFPVLFINEGCAVKTRKTLDQGSKEVISLQSTTVDAANEGKLVHLTGDATSQQVLKDPQLNVSVKALKLHRKVEMYQWEEDESSETKKKLGGGKETTTTYTYNKVWKEGRIDSSAFNQASKYSNPALKISSETWTANPIHVGEFTLDSGLVGQLNAFTPIHLEPSATQSPTAKPGTPRIINGVYYLGNNPDSPQIGDLRITLQQIPTPTEVSLVARQMGKSFQPFTGKSGVTIEMIDVGKHSAAAMFEEAQKNNKIRTWIVRLLGFVLMFFGFSMLFQPLSVVADVLPIAGTIVGAGTGIISFLIATIFSLSTIAVAWIFYRPLVGIPLLIGAGVALFFLIKKIASSKRSRA